MIEIGNSTSINVKQVNKIIKRRYGSVAGKARFRVVWNGDQLEKRFGTYTRWLGDIFLGIDKGVQERKKYAYLKPCWILEQYIGDKFDSRNFGIIKEHENTGYEPLYTFLDKNGEQLPVVMEVIDMMLYVAINGHPPVPKGEDEQAYLDRKVKEYEAYFENEAPLLSNEGGISYAGSYEKGIAWQEGNKTVAVSENKQVKSE